jgi:hypothetical protein
MPTFCRHNRFLERCPICSKTLPGRQASAVTPRRAKGSSSAGSSGPGARRRRAQGDGVRILREGRTQDDGYRSALVPGLRAAADAARLADEIAFSNGRLLALAAQPPDLYGEVRALAARDLERATWTCFLTAYLSPLQGPDPFAGVRIALAAGAPDAGHFDALDGSDWVAPDLDEVPLGPRTSHDPQRAAATLLAYRQWVQRGGVSAAAPAGAGSQELAFTGDRAWTPQRRFERLFERLALPGLLRTGRYDLLVTLGRLRLYELRPDSLHLGGSRGPSSEDPTTLAAKRLFGIGDPLLCERRAEALAQAIAVPIEALDLALANWLSSERVTMGLCEDTRDDGAFERAGDALGL